MCAAYDGIYYMYVLRFEITYINGIRYFPNFGSVQIANFTCDVYTNVSFLLFCCGSLLLVRISVLGMFVQIIITMKVKTMKVKTRIVLFAKALYSYSSYI